MQAIDISFFGNVAVSLDVRIVHCLFFMQFECVCIPISTLMHLGKRITNSPLPSPFPQSPKVPVPMCLCLAHVRFNLKLSFVLCFLFEAFLRNPPSQR